MDGTGTQETRGNGSPTRSSSSSHRRLPSGSSLLSKFPFMKPSPEDQPRADHDREDSQPAPRASTSIIQQQKTRRRRGSLRKVALLGRGAQRERKDGRSLTIDTAHATAAFALEAESARAVSHVSPASYKDDHAPGSSKDRHSKQAAVSQTNPAMNPLPQPERDPSGPYTSTDEDDVLQIPRNSASLRQGLPLASGSDPYYQPLGITMPRRRSVHQAKSPLSYSGISTSTLTSHDADWDYSDTQWWGYVVLCVTWFVFVIGMGSCLDIWSWAWDVGKTPYAPPELEDDPTLPIVGYYPALIILTGIMAWVWVITAWVGMKYFRHAKISGD